MDCKREKPVNWVLSNEFIDFIKKALEDKVEIAGKILFKDEKNCNTSVCKLSKKSTTYKTNRGNKNSVATPNGIINFHTHPRKCYIDANTIYGWPSGEDIDQCVEFARNGNLIHIVFALEGAYVIRVNEIIKKKDSIIVKRILQHTHEFRSPNPEEQNWKFNNMISILKLQKQPDPVETWKNLVNNLSLKNIYKLSNKLLKSRLTIPNDNTKVFSVKLVEYRTNMAFNTNYINEECHRESFR